MKEHLEYLHAYWRMEYVEKPKGKEDLTGLFTRIPKEADEKGVYLVMRGKHTYVVMNRYPYNAGHLLVVPYRAVRTLGELSKEEREDFMEVMVKAEEVLTKALRPDGFNIGFNIGSAAGAGIPEHIHCHIVPRWNGDTNFMPVLGQVKVLQQSLDAMWERLRTFV